VVVVLAELGCVVGAIAKLRTDKASRRPHAYRRRVPLRLHHLRGRSGPGKTKVCHCIDCQQLTGTAFRTFVPVAEHALRLSGEPTIYVRMGESGHKLQLAFCPRCGSPIYGTAVGDGPKVYFIRVGTVRQREQLIPRSQIWTRSQQHWVDHLASVPKVEKQ
jgi:hypothetical protein